MSESETWSRVLPVGHGSGPPLASVLRSTASIPAVVTGVRARIVATSASVNIRGPRCVPAPSRAPAAEERIASCRGTLETAALLHLEIYLARLERGRCTGDQ